MELLSSPITRTWRRYWRRKRYQRIDRGVRSGRRNMKVIRIGDHGSPARRVWKVKAARLRILKIASSPLKLLSKIRNAYMNMMLNLAGNVGYLNNDNFFGNKRIPKARETSARITNQEFEDRLVLEIYKALKATPY
ncbi:hypothetical protein M5689_007207 [Euphorbia peplus]|nr:hypothetical protein M5689_007207 [Euphorbia peplus]